MLGLGRNRSQKILKSWRIELDEFETTSFIPIIKSQLKALDSCFDDIMSAADSHITSKPSVYLIESISHVLSEDTKGITPKTLVQDYFTKLKTSVEREYKDPIAVVVETEIKSTSELSSWLTDIYRVCSSIEKSKDVLFTYKCSGHFKMFDENGNRIKIIVSDELIDPIGKLTFLYDRFEARLTEIVKIANSICENINSWKEDQVKAKRSYMRMEQEKDHKYNQLCAIILSIFLSSFFLTLSLLISDPLKLWQNNNRLKSELESLKLKGKQASTQLIDMNQELALLTSSNQKLKVENSKLSNQCQSRDKP